MSERDLAVEEVRWIAGLAETDGVLLAPHHPDVRSLPRRFTLDGFTLIAEPIGTAR